MGCQDQLVLTLAMELGFNIQVMLLDGQLEDLTYDACSPCPTMLCFNVAHQVTGG